MHRTALARTHRPRRFEEMVGQEAVSRTLRAAIEGGRVAHAYLFCGPRGVGKTTAARIVAMALNCPNAREGEPCGTCESCERIWSGRANLDVVEIDAASHRGVDDARDLRERAMYAPTSERRWKVYIVDEAHMLTRDAWNALLKILEEPPPRVIFVFATTEPQKIEQQAAPVLSRCQRFEFRRVAVPNIVRRLRQVLEAEGVEADEAGLVSIARRADGGVRDALSLLDQVLSFTGDRVEAEDVRRMLGLAEEERYLELLELVARRDRAAVFPFVQDLLDAGYDPAEFVRGLADALRLLLVLSADPETAATELSAESRDRFATAAEPFAEEDLLRLLMAVGDFEASGRLRRSAHPRIHLELLLLRLASMDSAVSVEELLAAAGGPPTAPDSGRDVSRSGGQDRQRARSRRRASRAADASSGTRRAEEGTDDEEAGEEDATDGSVDHTEPASATGEGTALRAWRAALSGAQGLGGQVVALRGARVESLGGETLRLQVPEGLVDDLRAYLEDRRRSASLRERVARELGLDPERLAFRVDRIGAPRRLTAEEACQQRLEEWMAVDPGLREAVETLDLTIKE